MFNLLPGTLLRRFHFLNAIVRTMVGIPLNLLLFWLIQERSSLEMKAYRKILLQTNYCDFVFLLLSALVQPMALTTANASITVLNGPFRELENPWNFWLFSSWVFIYNFALYGLSVQFIYRYLVLCRRVRITSLIYFTLLATLACVVALLYVLFLYVVAYPPEGEEFVHAPDLLKLLNAADEQNTTWRTTFYVNPQNPLFKLRSSLQLCMMGCYYVIVVVCTILTIWYLRRHASSNGFSKIREVNNQLSIILIVQTILPSLAYFAPTFYLARVNQFFVSDSKLMPLIVAMLITTPDCWVPALNPLVTILAVKSYRQQLSAFFSNIFYAIGLKKFTQTNVMVPAEQLRGTIS